jgi:hypothetical protein
MKFTLNNVSFNLNPLTLNATNSTANPDKPEDIGIMFNSEGCTFGIEHMEMEVSISELSNLCGKAVAAPTSTIAAPQAEAEKAKEEARAKAEELANMIRAVMHKIDDLKAAAPKAPTAPTKSSRSKKPKAPDVGVIDVNDEF